MECYPRRAKRGADWVDEFKENDYINFKGNITTSVGQPTYKSKISLTD